MKHFLFIVLFLISSIYLYAGETAQTDSLLLQSRQVLNESISLWNEGALLNARAQFERLLNIDSTSFLCHYYIAYADYRLASFYHTQEDNDKIEKVADDAIEHLQRALDLNPDFADGYAMLSSMYGEKIAVSPWKGIIYGPKAGSAMDKALELETDNPRTYLLDGTGKYFTPGLFGGGSEKAQKALLKAVEYFKTYKPKSALYPNWGERETYAWLGIIANDNGKPEQARAYYNQALKIDPDYGWVKYSLLPELEKSSAQK